MAKKKPALVQDSSQDIWRKIPPEEKLALMAQAHSRGVAATLLVLATCGTVAIGLKIPEIFWSTFLAIPFVFQFVSSRAWRDVKPRIMLEYLAARSAVRRYAFGTQCKDLTISLIFRGKLSFGGADSQKNYSLIDEDESPQWKSVWISLFPDTIVMISEQRGGAKLELARTIDDNIEVSTEGFEPDSDSSLRALTLTLPGRDGTKYSCVVKSDYPGALYVFERKIRGFIIDRRAQLEKDKLALTEMLASQAGDDMDMGMDMDLGLSSIN